MDTISTSAQRFRPHRVTSVDHGWFGRGVAVIRIWIARWSGRRALARVAMDPHLLRDLGLSQSDLSREIHKPFWRA